MVTRIVIFALVLAASSVVASDHPRRTKAEVIRIADTEAKRHGFDLRQFARPEAHYNYVQRDDTWVVFYEGKVVTTGNHFSVHIADKTKEIWLIPGR